MGLSEEFFQLLSEQPSFETSDTITIPFIMTKKEAFLNLLFAPSQFVIQLFLEIPSMIYLIFIMVEDADGGNLFKAPFLAFIGVFLTFYHVYAKTLKPALSNIRRVFF